MTHILVGAVTVGGLFLLLDYSRRHEIRLKWWQWSLTLAGFLYALFVLEVIFSFLKEGSIKGALVMGTILGFVAVVWGVLLGRFVFTRSSG